MSAPTLKHMLEEQRTKDSPNGVGGQRMMMQQQYLASINPALLTEEPAPNALAQVMAARPPAEESALTVLKDEEAGLIAVYRPAESRLHVGDSLHLTLSVLQRNQQCGGSLTEQDYLLLAEIGKFADATVVAAYVERQQNHVDESDDIPGLKALEIGGL
jgi:hypothetical protein